jgi:radical SAM protein with 4Fe4S-binding SPASM domain
MKNDKSELFFINEQTLENLENEDIDDDLMQYLINTGMIPGEKKPVDASQFQLEYFEFDPDCTHLSAPIVAGIEVTHACNLNCLHCSVKGGERLPNELTTGQIMRLYDEWADMRVFKVTVSGGEPLLREDILEILAYGDELNLRQFLLNNGSLMTEEIADQIPQSVRFGISIDGHEKTHDSIRGRGAYRKAAQAIELLKRKGRRVGIDITMSKINVDEVADVTLHWLQRGVRVTLNPAEPFGRGCEHKEILLTEEDAEQFIEARKLKIQWYKTLNREKYGGSHPLSVDDLGELFHRAFLSCQGAKLDTWVRYDGNVYPCASTSALGAFCMGNLRDTSFREMWEKSENAEKFRSIKKDSFSNCSTCNVTDVCNFRCPPLSHVLHGDFTVCGSSKFMKRVLKIAKEQRLTDIIYREES